jgi:hypothetical protein
VVRVLVLAWVVAVAPDAGSRPPRVLDGLRAYDRPPLRERSMKAARSAGVTLMALLIRT